MKFVQTDMTGAIEAIAATLRELLETEGRVLWLIPGGSNIPVIMRAHARIPGNLHARLAILLADERYGEFGHPASNLQQLTNAGFRPGASTVVPVLVPGLDFEATVKRYNDVIKTVLHEASAAVGFFGMGPDGHIAGILPGSVATTTKRLVAGFEGHDYPRITIGPKVIRQLDHIMLVAMGESKLPALESLRSKRITASTQPAQLLKQCKDVVIYSDQIGDAV